MLTNWLRDNLITLVVLIVGMVLAWGALSARVEAIEDKVSDYPSQDYFELKFQQIQDDINEIKTDVGENKDSIIELNKLLIEHEVVAN